MRQPETHKTQNPLWCDRWQPYRHREYIGHMVHAAYFAALLECDSNGKSMRFEVEYEGHGCLDAPEDIPAGSTLCVHTIGGYDREEYNRMPRGQDDWKAEMRAVAGVASALKGILANIDKEN